MPTPPPKAVLGPTNTGKTWYALDRMLGYASGSFGFPLRLLARENYERAAATLGYDRVALITGEEKIIPPSASHFFCTVEAMPTPHPAQNSPNTPPNTPPHTTPHAPNSPHNLPEFMAIDEIQLAADPERGHIFTDRILHARGRVETLLLGAETARPLIHALLPDCTISTRPRLSRLTWAGQKKVTRLPPRSAVVAFSAAEVYRIAELIRQHRGGTAIVMGALSPRTRNAQVALFQSGAVDYMVATDAIGMGLNMDIDHIALSDRVKFDGKHHRRLAPSELAQIAGRAGRHIKDGSFGITDSCPMLEDEVVAAIENHRFKPLTTLFWRNRDLDFSSTDALCHSLEAPPPHGFMQRKADADDHLALAQLLMRDDICNRAKGESAVRLLFDICQIPDYQKDYSDNHVQLLAQIYCYLSDDGALPRDWVAAQMTRLDRPEGDIDTLMARLSGIRAWNYITQKGGWQAGDNDFQERARAIEDRLSDRLNQVLTERFVDRRAAHLSRRLKEKPELASTIQTDGTVLVEGEEVGRLDGFIFTPSLLPHDEGKPVLAAARKTLPDEITRRVRALCASADAAFKPDSSGQIYWREALIGRFIKGDSLYQPRAQVKPSTLLAGDELKAVQDRLNAFAAAWPKSTLAPLMALDKATLTATARGIAYHLHESLGTVPSHQVAPMLKQLDDESRRGLTDCGVRFGVDMLYMPELLKPAQIEAKAILYRLWTGEGSALEEGSALGQNPSLVPPAGQVAIDAPQDKISDGFWHAIGYRRIGGRVIRVDMAERLTAVIRASARQGAFAISAEMLSLAGATHTAMEVMLADLGYERGGYEKSDEKGGEKGGEKGDENAEEDSTTPALFIRAKKTAKKNKAKKAAKNKPKNGKQSGKKFVDKKSPKGKPRTKPAAKKSFGKKSLGKKLAAKKPAEINPHSPFAVLAQLKGKRR